jgi:Magnesium chelatase, subunit ChlI
MLWGCSCCLNAPCHLAVRCRRARSALHLAAALLLACWAPLLQAVHSTCCTATRCCCCCCCWWSAGAGHVGLTAAPALFAQAKANRGILYVDEVNLLDDHLVDVLLDSAASGWNTVEREGISISHPARFILVGSGGANTHLSAGGLPLGA